MQTILLDWLPATIRIDKGTIADYRALSHFHYTPGDPATFAGIWKAVYEDDGGRCTPGGRHRARHTRTIAVAVLSHPTPALAPRERTLNLTGPRYGPKLVFVNRHVRTISRVIVHPQFRSIGLASALVRRICDDCPIRYVEASATMGDIHPFFEHGGMTRIPPLPGERPYFIFDREGACKA